jgi:hypothetical protein
MSLRIWLPNRARRREALRQIAHRRIVVSNAFPAARQASAIVETRVQRMRIFLDSGERFGPSRGDALYGYLRLRALPLRQWPAFGVKAQDVLLGASVAVAIPRQLNDRQTYRDLRSIINGTSPARPK